MPEAQNAASRGLVRLLSRVAPVEARELPTMLLAFCLFFCVFAGYFAVRPVRETIGTLLGRERIADLFVVTWVASLALVPIYGYLVSRFRRGVFLPWINGTIAGALALVGISLHVNESNVASGAFFYVFISVLNLFIVSVSWSFLLELFTQQQSKRLFGIIAAGGTFGALVGPLVTDFEVSNIGNSGVLFFGAFMFLLTLFFQRAMLATWARSAASHPPDAAPSEEHARVRGDRPIGGNPLAGLSKVLSSPYLLAIALFVMFIGAINTLLYFEQIRLVEAAYANVADRTRIFARMDWIVQSLTVVCQIFLTGRIASRFGLKTLLVPVPVLMIGGFLALAVSNTLGVLLTVFVARRVGEYAFIRPAREMLFSRVDNETRYKAKNVIDVPVYRGADALSAQVKTMVEGAGMAAAHVSLIGACLAGAWLVNAWYLGRKADAEERGG